MMADADYQSHWQLTLTHTNTMKATSSQSLVVNVSIEEILTP